MHVSLERGHAPAGGPQEPPFRWPDVLDGEPPGARPAGPAAYCLPQFEELAGVARIENVLMVTASPEGDLQLEDRLCVTTRALAAAIQGERDLVGAKLEEARRRSEVAAEQAPMVVRPLHKVSAWVLKSLRVATRGVATLPDRVGRSASMARAMLATREGRRGLLVGMRDPANMTRQQKAVALFTGTAGILAVLLVAHLAVTLIAPHVAGPWRSGLLLFLYGYVSSVGIPLPWEPALIAGAFAIGPIAAIAIAVVAKVVAGYMVFFLGDEVADKLEAKAARTPWFGKLVRTSEAFARRFGTLAMAVFIATPGLPDAIALYVFGSLHMPLRRYLLGIALGALVLDVVVIYGGLSLLGIGH